MSLPVKLKMFIGNVLSDWVVTERNSGTYPHAPQIHHNWIQLITACGTIAQQGVQNTHHWCRGTETATENRMRQAGSCCHYSSHLSVASLIALDQSCVFCTPFPAIFPTCYY